ncbi:MAG: hypothetical protein ABJC13_09335 [Acidobacteriota bacterium]
MEFGAPEMEFAGQEMDFGIPEMEFASPEFEFASQEMEFGTAEMEFGSQLAKFGGLDFVLHDRRVGRVVHHAAHPTESGDALSSAKSSIGPMLDFCP